MLLQFKAFEKTSRHLLGRVAIQKGDVCADTTLRDLQISTSALHALCKVEAKEKEVDEKKGAELLEQKKVY